jgi:hypothetical protein
MRSIFVNEIKFVNEINIPKERKKERKKFAELLPDPYVKGGFFPLPSRISLIFELISDII